MIPSKLLKEILADPYYDKCCLTKRSDEKIDFHHCFLYSGKSLQEKELIVPVTQSKHTSDRDSIHQEGIQNKELAQLIALKRIINKYSSLDYLEKKYPKKNWSEIYYYLINKYE